MAATRSKAKQPLTFGISYGLFSGPSHAKHFTQKMEQAGYKPAPPEAADIVIAHSAGCWQVQPDFKAKLVIYVGLPLALENPKRTWVKANKPLLKKLTIGPNRRRTARFARHYIRYGLSQPKRNARIIRNAKQSVAQPPSHAKVVCIANQHDAWMESPTQLDHYAASRDWDFIGLPGSHNTVWHRPELVIPIINHHARLLA